MLHEITTRSIADGAAKEAKLVRDGVIQLDATKSNLASNHKLLEAVVEGIVADLHEPSGMCTQLLGSIMNRIPQHPSKSYQVELTQLKREN